MSALSNDIIELNAQLKPGAANNSVSKEENRLPLNGHVKAAVQHYFNDLDGHMPEDLYKMVLSEVEKPLFEIVLQQCGSNLSQASRLLGINRATLRKKLCHYGIEH